MNFKSLRTWHSPGLSTNMSRSMMLSSERSHAPSLKSQHVPFDPDRGEQEAVESKRREKTKMKQAKRAKEGKREGIETLGCLHVSMCHTELQLGDDAFQKELCYLSNSKLVCTSYVPGYSNSNSNILGFFLNIVVPWE